MGDLDDSVRQVALHVLRHGPVPRGTVARALGLSAASLTRLAKPLLDAGVLVETAPATDPATRRPTRPLDVAVGAHQFVGVAVTGTDAWAVRTDLRTTVHRRARRPLPGTTPDQVADAVAAVVVELHPGAPPAGVGVVLAGAVDAGRVLQADALGWRPGVDLGAAVAARTGADVVVDDEVAALTTTELWSGLGREQPAFALLTLDTRVGYGLVVGGAVVRTAGPQLVGHLPLEPGGPRCPRGHRGCATALVTVPALLAAAHVAYGRPVGWRDLLVDAVDRVDRARRVVDDAARYLGRLVALVAGTTGVVQVVVDGAAADLAVVGYEALQAAVDEHRDPRSPAVELTVRDPDPHSWARGAAGAAAVGFATGPGWA